MMPYIQERFEKRMPMEGFHRKALDYFRQYLIVGGMPQVVQKCIAKYENALATPYILHDKDLKVEDGIVFLPLYMTPLL